MAQINVNGGRLKEYLRKWCTFKYTQKLDICKTC